MKIGLTKQKFFEWNKYLKIEENKTDKFFILPTKWEVYTIAVLKLRVKYFYMKKIKNENTKKELKY